MHDEPETAAPETLDLRGLKCPMPALLTRRALGRLAPGARLVVLCTDPLAGLDIPHLVRGTGDALLEATQGGAGSRFVIRRAAGSQDPTANSPR